MRKPSRMPTSQVRSGSGDRGLMAVVASEGECGVEGAAISCVEGLTARITAPGKSALGRGRTTVTGGWGLTFRNRQTHRRAARA